MPNPISPLPVDDLSAVVSGASTVHLTEVVLSPSVAGRAAGQGPVFQWSFEDELDGFGHQVVGAARSERPRSGILLTSDSSDCSPQLRSRDIYAFETSATVRPDGDHQREGVVRRFRHCPVVSGLRPCRFETTRRKDLPSVVMRT